MNLEVEAVSESQDMVRRERFPNFSDATTAVFYGPQWDLPDWGAANEHELLDVRVLAAVELWDGVVSGLAWTGRKIVGFAYRQIAGVSDGRTYVVRELTSPPPEQIVVRISEDFGYVYVDDPSGLQFGRVFGWFRESCTSLPPVVTK